MLNYLVPTMRALADLNLAHAHEVEQLRLDDQQPVEREGFAGFWRLFTQLMRDSAAYDRRHLHTLKRRLELAGSP